MPRASKLLRPALSLLLILLLLPGLCCYAAGGAQVSTMDIYRSVPVYIDGLLSMRGFVKGEYSFMSLDELCSYYGLELSWKADNDFMTVSLPGAELRGSLHKNYYTVEKRYLYSPEGWIIAEDELYLSVPTLCRLLNLSGGIDASRSRIDLSSERFSVIQGWESYYEDVYSYDVLYWMSHIISGEARFESLEGQIAVGNVIINRIISPIYPDNIYDVIFENDGAVQFEPTITGRIDDEPTPSALIAAKICLEGYNIIDDCMFFYNPSSGVDWFDNNLEYYTTIGSHQFYLLRQEE